MRRPGFALALGCILLLSGCLGSAATEPAPATSGEAESPTWKERTPAPSVVAEVAVAADGPRFYVVGGWTEIGGGSVLVRAYDAETDTWTSLPPYPLPVHHAQAAVVDSNLYVFGGAVTSLLLPGTFVAGAGPQGWPLTAVAMKLAPGADAWERVRDLPIGRGLGGAAVVDGKVYLVGGVSLDGDLATVHVYDPASDTYGEAAPLPTTRDHLTVLAHEGKVYALTGRSIETGNWDDIEANEVLDVATDTWTSLAPVPLGRGGQGGGVILGDRIALVGGERAEGEYTVYADAHAYDIATDTWHPLPNLPEPRHGMGAASWNGELFIMGGGMSDGTIETSVLALGP